MNVYLNPRYISEETGTRRYVISTQFGNGDMENTRELTKTISYMHHAIRPWDAKSEVEYFKVVINAYPVIKHRPIHRNVSK